LLEGYPQEEERVEGVGDDDRLLTVMGIEEEKGW